jgi:hypothetical protein
VDKGDEFYMPTKFEFTQNFSASPVDVFAVLSNEEFILAKCAATGSLSTLATVDLVNANEAGTLTSTRVLPADLPAPAKSLVGDTITVTETQVWSAPSSDGARTATISVEFSGPIAFSGTLELSATPTGHTSITTRGAFAASVPFIGGKIEKVAAEQTQRYLVAEERVAGEWLSR